MGSFLFLIIAIFNIYLFQDIDIRASLFFTFIAGMYFQVVFPVIKKN